MPTFRRFKTELRNCLKQENLSDERLFDSLPSIIKTAPVEQWISPLFSCLLEPPPFSVYAAKLLGYAVAQIYESEKEKARVIVRRMIWQMNEESGNIGWGIPVAFAQVLIHSKGLAEEYHRILLSYILERDGDSNYCDYAPLRISCFEAVEMLLDKYPQYGKLACTALTQGKNDEDVQCRKKAVQMYDKFQPCPEPA